MENLKEAGKVLIESVSVSSNNEQLKRECEKRVSEMESKLDDLFKRKNAIEKECNKASVRFQDFKELTEILENIVAKVKPKLGILKSGPKIGGNLAKNDINSTNAWHAECEVRKR